MDTHIPPGAVVVGVDGSETAQRAASWAADLAHRERRTLVLVHAIEAPPLPYGNVGWVAADTARWRRELTALAHTLLRETRESLREERADLDVRHVVSDEDPRTALDEASRHAHVVVVGTHGHRRVARMLLGSVSEYTARHGRCPVVVVREPVADGPVVAGIDDDGGSGAAVLEFAFGQASVWDRPLRVVHADARAAVPLDSEDEVQGARLLLAEAIAGFGEKYPDVVVSSEVLPSDDLESALVDVSRTASLLVLGRHPRGRVREALVPPVVSGVLERARSPVAVVPGPARTS